METSNLELNLMVDVKVSLNTETNLEIENEGKESYLEVGIDMLNLLVYHTKNKNVAWREIYSQNYDIYSQDMCTSLPNGIEICMYKYSPSSVPLFEILDTTQDPAIDIEYHINNQKFWYKRDSAYAKLVEELWDEAWPLAYKIPIEDKKRHFALKAKQMEGEANRL